MLKWNLFWTVATVVSTGVELIAYNVLIYESAVAKKSRVESNISLCVIIALISIMTILEVNINVKLLIGMILEYSFVRYYYRISTSKNLLILLLFIMALTGFDAISSGIMTVFNPSLEINDILNNSTLKLQVMILSKTLLISIIPLIKSIKLKDEIRNKDFIYIIMPIITNILVFVILFGLALKYTEFAKEIELIILFISIMLLLSNLSIINIVRTITRSSKIKLENELIKGKMDMQYKYYLNIQENQMKIKKLYHDMNNHMVCIQHICDNNEITKRYTDNIYSELSQYKSLFRTNNMILDILLSEKKEICNINDIELSVDINFSSCNYIDIIDVCSIFSNMIDNAIEACNKIHSNECKKYIKLRGTIVNDFFVIKCENSKINKISKVKNRFITDKKDDFFHGIGINSMKTSVEKYNGSLAIDHSDYKFVVNIYIPII